jgi:hypothetical protein
LPIQTNNDTNILPDSFTKIPDTISVFGDDNLAILDTIRKTSEIRTALASISLLNYSRKSAAEITKIFRFTSLNDRINLVPINYLLVDHLLPCWSKLIKINRSYVNGGVLISSWLA